ncbi:3-dehydroquinate synthase [Parvularcula maris]|uniref:3-dehydroquinate synthase n=1 Tax=Parvularcula maris TaxID=2965077 RepID=A0A9X2RHJ7_9PROT|nr:3-dehydroquinate synthase [Parvularcula maris]MCQ8184949.1 3-dehydroquinate synthase [Parvularcula maris]
MSKVRVGLGDRAYDILIGSGAFQAAAGALRTLTEKPSAIVADETVLGLYDGVLEAVFGEMPIITLPSGESAKSFAEYARVSEELLAAGVERGGSVVALGGGVTGDLAGFCAATLRRGCKLVMVPTTLLSQVDSSVGGKTAVNTRAGKNLVGAFHQPSLVVIDTDFLASLPPRELLAGYAEVVKYGALGDESFFAWLERHSGTVLACEEEALRHVIETSCRMKAEVVAEDEREAGRRALLNLGHTFGHAVEAEAGYGGGVLHGEAVALGMAMAARFSVARGLAAQADADRLERHLASVGLPTRLAALNGFDASAETLLGHMMQDKKVEGGTLTLILMRRLGEAFVAKDQDQRVVLEFLEKERALAPS